MPATIEISSVVNNMYKQVKQLEDHHNTKQTLLPKRIERRDSTELENNIHIQTDSQTEEQHNQKTIDIINSIHKNIAQISNYVDNEIRQNNAQDEYKDINDKYQETLSKLVVANRELDHFRITNNALNNHTRALTIHNIELQISLIVGTLFSVFAMSSVMGCSMITCVISSSIVGSVLGIYVTKLLLRWL